MIKNRIRQRPYFWWNTLLYWVEENLTTWADLQPAFALLPLSVDSSISTITEKLYCNNFKKSQQMRTLLAYTFNCLIKIIPCYSLSGEFPVACFVFPNNLHVLEVRVVPYVFVLILNVNMWIISNKLSNFVFPAKSVVK